MGTSYCLNRALISVLMYHRRSIGLHRNGVPARLKKLIVRTHCLVWFENYLYLRIDIASKLNLIAPIAEQCQHKYASIYFFVVDRILISCSMFHRERPEKEYECVIPFPNPLRYLPNTVL